MSMAFANRSLFLTPRHLTLIILIVLLILSAGPFVALRISALTIPRDVPQWSLRPSPLAQVENVLPRRSIFSRLWLPTPCESPQAHCNLFESPGTRCFTPLSRSGLNQFHLCSLKLLELVNQICFVPVRTSQFRLRSFFLLLATNFINSIFKVFCYLEFVECDLVSCDRN